MLSIPVPIHDKKEIELIEKLTKKYEKFTTPGKLTKFIRTVGSVTSNFIGKMTPNKVKEMAGNAFKQASEIEFIKEALKQAASGGNIVAGLIAKHTIDKNALIKTFQKHDIQIETYEEIVFVRSYCAEKVSRKDNVWNITASGSEGTATGFFGIFGVPIDLVLSFLLYFRAVQSVAFSYGYNVKEDPAELEIASQVLFLCLAPSAENGGKTIAGMLGKMMLFAEGAALQKGLNKSFGKMITEGGVQLFFVQLRAMANGAAKIALEKAGQKGLEAGVLQGILKQFASVLTKKAAQRSIPVVSALVGGLVNVYTMNKILEGANLIYHKRFLLEKEERCKVKEG